MRSAARPGRPRTAEGKRAPIRTAFLGAIRQLNGLAEKEKVLKCEYCRTNTVTFRVLEVHAKPLVIYIHLPIGVGTFDALPKKDANGARHLSSVPIDSW